ncbi:MAG: 1-deoxy-D-xylulose-5-phosphate reductoisomerase [Rhodothermales bacterium]|nr:1-deoxy-D-xylulose-5-phosphate reductoisomerase [Rhodothermales bacterium]
MNRPDARPAPTRRDANKGPVQRLAVLGATGSIGTQTLDVVRLFPEKFKVVALAAYRNIDRLYDQAIEFRPACVAVGDAACAAVLQQRLAGTGIVVVHGREGLREAACWPEVDVVMAAIVGFAGLESVIAGIEAGRTIALANKETLVVAGARVNALLAARGGRMVPVDSEHSAIFQCLVGEPALAVESITLTASGGPFRTRPAGTFAGITREEALQHPNWAMGSKITIDSATMMNKGLEVIEAHWLFHLAPDRIDVLVHPQSIVHSMVTFADGSTKAQMGQPDMKVPIQYALSYPDRWPAPHPRIDWGRAGRLDFERPDRLKFPCLDLAYEALRRGGAAPAVLNAANEAAVGLFLQERIRFIDIPNAIEKALAVFETPADPSIEDLVAIDQAVRARIEELYGAPAY